MAKKKRKKRSLLSRLLAKLYGPPKSAPLYKSASVSQFPGQEGLNPYVPVSPHSVGFHQKYMPQPGQQSTMMRNNPSRQQSDEDALRMILKNYAGLEDY